MLPSLPVAGSAAAAVWTLEHGSRAGWELCLQPGLNMLPVCTPEVGGKLFVFFLSSAHFLGMKQLDVRP